MNEVRRCQRCGSRLSSWNTGKFCNPCWEAMPRTERMKHKSEWYKLESDLRKYRKEIHEIESDPEWQGRSPSSGID